VSDFNPPPVAQRVLRECRDMLERDLGEWITDLGPLLVEEIHELANATRDSARQAEYLRLQNELRAHWDTLAEAFNQQLMRGLQHVRVVESTRTAVRFEELQLVDDKDLAERIVMREFAARVTESCSEELYALERRMALLIDQDTLDNQGNPLGPTVVCDAARSGCEALCSDPDSRMLLLRQLERHLKTELPVLYRVVNEILIDAGILPELKRVYRRNAVAGTFSTSDAANILNTLQRLAQARVQSAALPAGVGVGQATAATGSIGVPGGLALPLAGGMGSGVGTGTELPPGSIAVSAEFLQSLQTLQALPTAEPGNLTNLVRLARDSDAARQAPPLDAITMDIVATLFDLIFDDAKVPDAVKGMVSRLQIPVLKVAMVDPRFFAERAHPARRFLDSISGITIRWGGAVNEGDPFYIKLSALVEQIQSGFDQDVAIFGTAVAELSTFVTEHEEKEAETSRLVAEALQRKQDEAATLAERHGAALAAAEAFLAPLLEKKIPRPIQQFLRTAWRDVLVHLSIGHGLDGTPVHKAQRIAEELAWSVTPKKTTEDRQRLAALLPKLLPAIHQGLDRLAAPAEARQPLFDALMTLHSAALHADKRQLRAAKELEAPTAPEPSPVVELQVTHVVEGGIHIEEVTLHEPELAAGASQHTNPWLRRVKHLVRGDWIDFIDDGQVRRERLTWLSPRRTLYLFSNHATSAAISITPEALAHRLQNETARLVENDPPMFERALDGAIKALDQAA
jgi:hypothetical protein